MKVVSDFHIHGPHSRATSKNIDIPNLVKYAKIKGVGLLGTGDFTHPVWIKYLKENLKEDETGILRSNDGFPFILQTEISLIYTQGGRGRRVHNIVLAPNFETVSQITEELLKRGRVDYDGRPIFKIPCPEFVELMKKINNDIEVIPAHIWTPWFSLFGSNSGFNSVEECFQDQTKHIFALETGLSSDPAMNWRLSSLDKYALVSNSDSHSFWPWRIGREVNVFEMKELTYKNFINVMKEKDPKQFLYTIEVSPNYGKYHFDGHRECGVCMSPKESEDTRKICPVCKRQMTIGVLNRVEELADREEGHVPKNAIPFKTLIPLSEILSAKLGIEQLYSKRIWHEYNKMINIFGSELSVLINASVEQLKEAVSEPIAKAIVDIRNEKIKIAPGFDGVYGYPVFDKKYNPAVSKSSAGGQKSLTEFN
ncbi:MAG: endonuclease Q family protein [Nanoarchaeota archaeon]